MRRLPSALRLAALITLVLASCDAGTGGRLVDLAVDARALEEASGTLGVFETDEGWTVTLTEARLAIGALYAFAPDPDAQASLRKILFPSVALAHGGLDPLSGRRVRAEVIAPFVVDLLATTPLELGVVRAEAGAVSDVELRYGEVSDASSTRGAHAYFVGVARRELDEIFFEGGLEVPSDGTKRRVEGIALDASIDDESRLRLGIRASEFFRGVRFEELDAPADNMSSSPLRPGLQPTEAMLLGIRSPSAFTAEIVVEESP